MFIAFIVLALIALVAAIAAALCFRANRKRPSTDAREGGVFFSYASGVVGAVALLFLILSCLTSIGTQDIGVKTAFGKTVGNGLKPGIHWKAPWEKVHRLDFKTQTDTYASNGFDGPSQAGAKGGCINVRIARQATACVNVSIRWQNEQAGVDYLFKNYKSDDNIRLNLLHRDLQAAVNVAFGHYDPLGIDTNGNSTQPTNAQLGQAVQDALASSPQVQGNLRIFSVLIPLFSFDDTTQARLNAVQQQVAETRRAQQALQTAKAQAAANRELAKSVSNNPGVLESKCLDILNEAVQKGKDLPTAFSCFPGGSGLAAVTAK